MNQLEFKGKTVNVNELPLLGTIKNTDESKIIVYAEQVYDSTEKHSVQHRLDNFNLDCGTYE